MNSRMRSRIFFAEARSWRRCSLLGLLLLLRVAQLSAEAEGNVLGRVQQLEVDLQSKLHDQLRAKVVLALDGAQHLPGDAEGEVEAEDSGPSSVPLLRTGLIVPPDGAWGLLDKVRVDISEEAPACVFAPQRPREQLEALQKIQGRMSAHAVVSSRLLHAARMIRLARALVREHLDLPSNSHKRIPSDPDTRPALLYVFAPQELADALCLVAQDEVQEYTFRSTCSTYSEARRSRKLARCSLAVWGVSSQHKHKGRTLASSFSTFQAGVEVDLDEGDSVVPQLFSSSAIPGVYGALEKLSSDSPRQVAAAQGGPYTVVTAFSKNHYTVGLRLMNSILVHGQESPVPFSLVAWTMETFGAVAREQVLCMAEQLNKAKISTVVKSFDFAKYPLWTYVRHYKAGWWAWKAIMLWETFAERGGSVLWIDAGNLVTSPKALSATFTNLHKQGFVGVTDPWFGMNFRWTHPSTITFLGADIGADTTQCCGCLFGVTAQTYESMLRPMFECSLTLQCLAPEGSNMGNHRQDQSVLSVLAWHNGLACTGADEHLRFKCDSNRYHCSEPPLGGAKDVCNVQ